MNKTVILLSGGIDSTVLAHSLISQGYDLLGLTINYGQVHQKEIQYAMMNARKLNIPWRVIHINGLGELLPGNQLTGVETSDSVIVPNRNAVLLSIAASVAIANGYDSVAFAAHADDYEVFLDCRDVFFRMLNAAFNLGDDRRVKILANFTHCRKFGIILAGLELGVDFSMTWSCYRNNDLHCGACATCQQRRQAFIDARVSDPTEYME